VSSTTKHRTSNTFSHPADRIGDETENLLIFLRGMEVCNQDTIAAFDKVTGRKPITLGSAEKTADDIVKLVFNDSQQFIQILPGAKRLVVQVSKRESFDSGFEYVKGDHLRFEYIRQYTSGSDDMARGFWIVRVADDKFVKY